MIAPSRTTPIKLDAMKENFGSIVGEVANLTSFGIDALHGVIETPSTGITDSALVGVDQSCLVAAKRLDTFLIDATHGQCCKILLRNSLVRV